MEKCINGCESTHRSLWLLQILCECVSVCGWYYPLGVVPFLSLSLSENNKKILKKYFFLLVLAVAGLDFV